jgi:hypothetical protein
VLPIEMHWTGRFRFIFDCVLRTDFVWCAVTVRSTNHEFGPRISRLANAQEINLRLATVDVKIAPSLDGPKSTTKMWSYPEKLRWHIRVPEHPLLKRWKTVFGSAKNVVILSARSEYCYHRPLWPI